ncbi:MAG: hypothetical protein PHZ19_05765, partial [Candidatus Thermoplasmatota archaeon]|nr:hypothetical protein [Candidatus Thermoplasmatota archaeon]
ESNVNNFASLLRKQEALRHLFAEDGKHLLILDDCNNVPINLHYHLVLAVGTVSLPLHVLYNERGLFNSIVSDRSMGISGA